MAGTTQPRPSKLDALGSIALTVSGSIVPPPEVAHAPLLKDGAAQHDSNSRVVSINPRLQPTNKSNFKYSRLLRTITADSNYKKQCREELEVHAKDTITLHSPAENGWCQGQIGDETGWFPVAVSEELSLEAHRLYLDALNYRAVDDDSIIENKEKLKTKLNRKLRRRPKASMLQEKYILHNGGPWVSGQVGEVQQSIVRKERALVLSNMLAARALTAAMGGNSPFEAHHGSVSDVSDAGDQYSLDHHSEEEMTIEEQCIELFASRPNKAVQMMIDSKIVKNDPHHIANYLFKSRALSKPMIGDYLGDPDDLSRQVLSAYLGKMNFQNDEFDQALRKFLLTFKLPGEAQKIDRIMEAFAEKYYQQYSGKIFKSKDAIYVLAFSTIMLNTDLHNPSIKRKMEQSEFVGNNRGINEGEDLPAVFLEDLYQRINEEEIKTEDTKQYPHAIKRGYLFLERKSRIRGKKKLFKLWWILDTESNGLYGYKRETDEHPEETYRLTGLTPHSKQNPSRKQSLFPMVFDYVAKEGHKPVEVRLLATSQRLWVDWLSLLTNVLRNIKM